MNRIVVAVGGAALLVAGAIGYGFYPRANPKTPEDCRFSLGATRENCLDTVAIELFRTDPAAGIAFTERQLPDQLSRDFVYLYVTQHIDARSLVYCEKIVNKTYKATCMERVKRPHLDGTRTAGSMGHGAPGAQPQDGPPPP